tara:strand:- start:126 stop:506 length:381 start_codon:yes stop_codon:yes gene_type:complete
MIKSNVTQREIFEALEGVSTEEYIYIEYYKIPSRKDLNKTSKKMLKEITSMSIEDFMLGKAENVINKAIKTISGERKEEFYRRTNEFRNASGYLLFQDKTDGFKSVDIRNIISITINGVRLDRNNE